MGTAIVITSGKGGTGKTTSVGAIASCLAVLGHRTLCIDCDVGLKNLDLVLGLTDVSSTNFCDVIDGSVSLDDAVCAHPQIENLFFLSAPITRKPEDISAEAMKSLVLQAKDVYDYCLIDSPAGLGAGFRLAVSGADMAIVVATGDAASLRDGQRVVAELIDTGIRSIRLLVNRVRPRLYRRVSATVDDVIDSVGAQLLGMIAEDDAVIVSANMETPLILYENKNAAAQYLRIARRLSGEKVPLGKI
ncbi:MAG: septum site-determining protein MinD [Oscillospiraceae bacterium]